MMRRNTVVSRVALASAIALACAAAPAFAAGRANLGGLAGDTAFDQFIVKYRDGTAERGDVAASDRALARAARAVPGRGALGVRHLRRMALGAEVVRSDRKLDRVDAETLMRSIAAEPAVEYVEVDAKMYPVYTPNDPQYPSQWHYQDTAGGIDAADAWDTNTGSGLVVAVLDTGSTSHSDLNANTVAGYDFITSTFVSRDGNGRDSNPADPGDWNPVAGECYAGSPIRNSSWHGTHVAGTIAALTNNGIGVAGVAHGARIQHVRVLGRCGGNTSDIADAIVWASGGSVSGVPANANPARVINMSLGGGGACSSTYQNAINSAVNRGSVVVVAAGNSNGPVSNFQPASCANVIAVGATDSSGARAWFSNYGAGVDIAAPGVNVLSTLNSGTQGPVSESYAYYSGTSMAAPHVAGVAALAQSRRTAVGLARFTPSQLETHLKNTARAFPVAQGQANGVGIVDAEAAVAAIVPPPPQPPFIYGIWCSGSGSGFCNVSYAGDEPMTFQWSGGSGFSDGATYYNVCGQVYYPFYTTVQVTLENAYGTASAYTEVYCTGGLSEI
jgi:serine protease